MIRGNEDEKVKHTYTPDGSQKQPIPPDQHTHFKRGTPTTPPPNESFLVKYAWEQILNTIEGR